MGKIRFQGIPQPETPPDGKIWLWYDRDSEYFKIMRDDGVPEPLIVGSGGTTRLIYLLDVNIDAPEAKQTLTYDGLQEKWINRKLVTDSLSGSETDVAPSVQSVKEYIQSRHVVEYFTLTEDHALAKAINLSFTPIVSQNVMLDIIGGGPQVYGDDFTVSESSLSWDSLLLDGVLSDGDRLRVSYFK